MKSKLELLLKTQFIFKAVFKVGKFWKDDLTVKKNRNTLFKNNNNIRYITHDNKRISTFIRRCIIELQIDINVLEMRDRRKKIVQCKMRSGV